MGVSPAYRAYPAPVLPRRVPAASLHGRGAGAGGGGGAWRTLSLTACSFPDCYCNYHTLAASSCLWPHRPLPDCSLSHSLPDFLLVVKQTLGGGGGGGGGIGVNGWAPSVWFIALWQAGC